MKSSRAWPSRAAGLALRAAGLFLVWLAIDDNVAQPELFTGVAVALLALGLAIIVGRSSTVHPRVRLSMLKGVPRLPFSVLVDTARVVSAVLRALVRRSGSVGRLRAVRYRASSDRPDDVARRVLSAWAGSIAPNAYVIGIDPEQEVLLVHELARGRRPVDPLGLG